VTPNLPEAEALTGVSIASDMDRREAATRLIGMGAPAVIIKGGHFPATEITDLLYDGSTFTEFRGERVPGRHTHGTGCTFAAALTAELALGHSLIDAIPRVQRYVAGAIRHAPGLGAGNGPVDHFWKSRP
jgi:hydroxymethylpyrimidine/phosphomethylpyrimidine kinase